MQLLVWAVGFLERISFEDLVLRAVSIVGFREKLYFMDFALVLQQMEQGEGMAVQGTRKFYSRLPPNSKRKFKITATAFFGKNLY